MPANDTNPAAGLRTAWGRLLVLTALHFIADFCGGLTIPLPEPTLVNHLGVGLPRVALLLGLSAIVVNLSQPISGWFLPKRGLPALLWIAPLTAALIAGIGLSRNIWAVAALLFTAALGIGIVHPEGALAAHSLAGRNKGVGVGMYMAGGYFGVATGSLVSALWVEWHDQTLARFWVLGLPAVAVAVLVLLSGLHRLKGHAEETGEAPAPGEGRLPFGPVLSVSVCLAVTICLLMRYITILLVRSFPDADAQAWGGTTVFAMGAVGAVGALGWGHLSERIGRARAIFAAQLLSVPFLWGLLHVPSPRVAPLWAIGLGLSLGSVFPLGVVLARQAHGVSQRLRLGLSIGGAWGVGELVFIAGGKYIGMFPDGDPRPVRSVLNLCWFFLALTAMLALFVARQESTHASAAGRLATQPGAGP